MTSHIHYFRTLYSVRTKIISYSIHLNSWQPGVAPCMHGALSTQKLELHAIQLWGCIRGNLRSCQGSVPSAIAPGPGVTWATELLYLQAKKQWTQATYSIPFHSPGPNFTNPDLPHFHVIQTTKSIKWICDISLKMLRFGSKKQIKIPVSIIHDGLEIKSDRK